ncbi:DNA-3-methyladenine glycosylase III [Sulfuricurvum kujiense DSM 16994]|uniref:DNA-3-methyladenine glycosylase III n=1 Tax=Sulfuricurvum kujiense (strain ATCC BAA-921 / DSM 16994 / JCM 11577 / YK-1) TaxID=709032 RepID=E4U034_SULKY|nr:3-methyladenine DNA glycosylase [Sulfuricurvum kujiense]ADR33199.1 DNA-3-methyladenine glycosylase III [Sulfuricurvum kujiense DSM 16994]
MELQDSWELFSALEKLKLLENSPPLWWPAYGTFEVVVGAVLTQNTQWERVQISLDNLRNSEILAPDLLAQTHPETLMELIRPSGLFKAKASNLIRLSRNMMEEFGDFETFALSTDRNWLLSQKGVGPETADSILCYACARPSMVVDAYTARLLNAFGYEFESYDELQEWCETGVRGYFDTVQLPAAFARFHGMIVEYVKSNSKGKAVNIERISSTI